MLLFTISSTEGIDNFIASIVLNEYYENQYFDYGFQGDYFLERTSFFKPCYLKKIVT